ncbi:Omp28-related outer membrane protein [Taibaiella lutea]|uniref:Omp28-related outer membrane protein n=1 Tax=Taibaiella lutea TaxID=2608001 RepID=A0A5M6CIK4_9BACT|nr:Omp28-related outer membrane protein [Taibaiella lutea]KAA5535038.1 Omp28-related outer membrane protein [Taibaiella lutea]
MKRLLLPVLFLMTGVAVFAQTPQNKKRVVVFDFSDTWCSPCGQFGVAVADTVDNKLQDGDKGYLIGIKGSFEPSSPAWINALGAGTLFDNFGLQGVPTLMVGNYESQATTGNNAGDIADIMNATATFDAKPVVASTAANMTINGNVLTVNAKAKFWEDATGEYYMTAFLAEDNIVAAQASNLANTIHHHVLKGAMATTGAALNPVPWGEQIGSSSITANTEFPKTYTVNIDTVSNKENLEVYILLFKKNGSTYEYINAEKAKKAVTGLNEAMANISQVKLYPNPTNNASYLELNLTRPMQVNINVTDVLGRQVYKVTQSLYIGQNTIAIPSYNFEAGQYNVTITDENQSRFSRKLIVNE